MKSADAQSAGETPATNTRASTRGNCRQCGAPAAYQAPQLCARCYKREWAQQRRHDIDVLAEQHALMMLEPCPYLTPRARRRVAVELARRGHRVAELAWYLGVSERTVWRALAGAGVTQPPGEAAAALPTVNRAVLPTRRRDSVA